MKLVYYELMKVLGKKIFLILICLCFLLNIGLFCFLQQTSENSIYNNQEYKAIINRFSKMSFKTAEQKISEETKAYEILSVMRETALAETKEELQEYINVLNKYKEENPRAYSASKRLNKSGFDKKRETYFYELSRQVNYINSYPKFIGEMDKRAFSQSEFSVFKDNFSYRNLFKTAEDFRGLKQIKLSIGNDIPVTSALSYKFGDYFLIVIVFLSCVYLFLQDKESLTDRLIRSSKKGRIETISAKFIALFIITLFVCVIFSAGIFTAGGYLYGDFDLTRQIQSVSDFQNCNLNLNIGQFCVLSLLCRAISMLLSASIFALLFIIFSNTSFVYLISALLISSEYFLYNSALNTTFSDYFKYINIFYASDSSCFLGKYINISIFNEPVSVYALDILVFSFLIILSTVISCVYYCLKANEKTKIVLPRPLAKIKDCFHFTGSAYILNGERYKFFWVNKMLIFSAVIVLLAVLSSLNTIEYPYLNAGDVPYKAYMEKLEGDLTADKEKFIERENKYFKKLNMRVEDIDNDESLSVQTREVLINTINRILETEGSAFERVNNQYKRLKTLNTEGIEAKFIDENLYADFINNSEREWVSLVLIILLMLVSVPFVFTVEYKRNMINLIQPTRNGKLRLYFDKLSIVFFAVITEFICVYAPYFISFLKSFGANSLRTPIVCINVFKCAVGKISVLNAFLLNMLCYFSVVTLSAMAIVIFSVFLKNHMLTLVISTITLVMPCILIFPNQLIRAGAIFCGNYRLCSFTVIFVSILTAVILMLLSLKKFINRIFYISTSNIAVPL